MTTYDVLLRLTIDEEGGKQAPPSDWTWENVLHLDEGEGVQMLSCDFVETHETPANPEPDKGA